MSKIVDLTGKVYEGWTVIGRDMSKVGSNCYWLCRCVCGKERFVSGNALVRGRSKSCGCLRITDLTGKRFGKLKVLGKDKSRKYYWLCECECGNMKSISGSNLRNEGTKSCGCMRKIPDISGKEYGRWKVIGRVDTGKKGSWWRCKCKCGKEKVVSYICLDKGERVLSTVDIIQKQK